MPLITEELFLLLRNDEGRLERYGTATGYGLTAAMITDLMLAGRLGLTDDKQPRLRVLSTQPTGNPVLDPGLAQLADRDGDKLRSLITKNSLNPEQRVAESLAAAGIVELGGKGFLGMGRERTPVLNPMPEQQLRARLAAVLAGSTPPTVADSTLLSVLQGLQVARYVLKQESGGANGRQLGNRIEQVVRSTPAGDAVAKAVQAMNAAVMTAAIMPVIATSN
ncbi:GOLPH3/VPS74 family protein [Nakamurella aerolata]|uniref:GPP34 family phosphoprotein n=1 Tax=Nakamurella aerolata TaxID=1656892 RepID=A0A849AGV0_9ACTN|nr:GPP34 family phosphoprotein [Nakamurella aerolata]NNG36072.1 GPP34 family phosphoprotein [Nakamurella aerolata]